MTDQIRSIDNTNIFRFLSPDGTPHELKPDDKSKEFTVVWLDEKNDASLDCIDTQRHLRYIFNYLEIFTDEETCMNYLIHDDVQDRKILFIVSGLLAMKVIPRVTELRQIIYIYIFCQTPSDIISNGIKVRGTFVDKHTLFATLTYDAQERSTIITENTNFDDFQNFLKVIISIDYSDSLPKDEMVKQCRYYYQGNKHELKKIDEFEATYTSTDAISWYTKDSFIYRLLNKALRTRNVEIIYTFRYFIVHLCRQIHELHWQQFRDAHRRITTLYRGQFLSSAELQSLKERIGKEISMNSFLSTSGSCEIAFKYSGEGKGRPFYESVVFQIDLVTDELNPVMPYCSIAHISNFPVEDEYLFRVGTVFQLIDIDEVLDGVWLIHLKLTNVMSHSIHKTSKSSKEVLLDFFKASVTNDANIKNIDKLIGEIPLKYCDLMSGYIKVGETYENGKDLVKQLNCFEKALEIYENIPDNKQELLQPGYNAIYYRLIGFLYHSANITFTCSSESVYQHRDHTCFTGKFLKFYERRMTHTQNSISTDYQNLTIMYPFPRDLDRRTLLTSYNVKWLEKDLQMIELILNRQYAQQLAKTKFDTTSNSLNILINYQELGNKISETINYETRCDVYIATFIRNVCNSAGWNYKWSLQLIHKGHELIKDATLAEYNIENGAYLIIRQSDLQIPRDILNYMRDTTRSTIKNIIQIHIELCSGSVISISLSPDELVEVLKYRIYDYSNIPNDQQALYYNDYYMRDWYTIRHYHVENGSIIDFACRPRFSTNLDLFLTINNELIEVSYENKSRIHQAIQDVHESYNNTSIEAKQNALRRVSDNLHAIVKTRKLFFFNHSYSVMASFIHREIRKYDQQLKLL